MKSRSIQEVMNHDPIRKSKYFLRTALLAAVTLGLSATVHATDYTWGGGVSSWNDIGVNGWNGGPPVTGDTASIPGGIVSFTQNDTFGHAGTPTSAAITLNGGTLASGGFFNTIWNLTLNGGTLLANGGVNNPYGAFQVAGTVTVTGSVASVISVGGGSFNTVTLGAPYTTFDVADVTASSAADLTISTVLNTLGTSGLIKAGVGTLTLTAANTYTGSTVVNAGTLHITGGYSGSGNLVVNGGSLTLNMGDGLASFNGDGYGNSPLIGDGNFVGNLTLTSGTLNVNTNSASASIRLGCNGGSANGTINVNGGTMNVPGRILMAANNGGQATLTLGGGLLNLGKAGSYTTSGDPACGVLWFGGYKSTVNLNSGTLALFGTKNSSTAIAGSAFNFNGGTLKAVANNNTDFLNLPSGMSAVVKSGGAIIDNNGFDITIAPPLLDGTGGGGLTKNNSGTLTLTGTNTYLGATTINGGTLALNGAGQLGGSSYAGAITNSGAFLYNSSAAQILSGAISGAGSLTQQGSGTLTLAGANTYTGATIVNAGTLRLKETSISYIGSQFNIGSGWRTASVPKTYGANGSNVLGNDGWFLAAGASSQIPGYLTAFYNDSCYGGNGGYAVIDNPFTTPGASPTTVYSGITNQRQPGYGNKADGVIRFTLTAGVPSHIRVGVMTDNTDASGVWGASGIQITSTDVASMMTTELQTTGGSYTGEPRWVFFDIQGGVAGQTYSINVNGGPAHNAGIGAVSFDTVASSGTPTMLPSATALSIASGATLDLAFTGTNTIRTLTVNTVLQVRNKVYSSSNLPQALTGSGFLKVTEGAPPHGTLIRFY